MFDSIALSDPHDRFVILISLTHASDMRWWVQAKVFNSAKSWVKSLQDVWFIAVGAFMIFSWVNWFLISSDSKIFGCYNHRLSKHTEDQGVRAASFIHICTNGNVSNKHQQTITHMTWNQPHDLDCLVSLMISCRWQMSCSLWSEVSITIGQDQWSQRAIVEQGCNQLMPTSGESKCRCSHQRLHQIKTACLNCWCHSFFQFEVTNYSGFFFLGIGVGSWSGISKKIQKRLKKEQMIKDEDSHQRPLFIKTKRGTLSDRSNPKPMPWECQSCRVRWTWVWVPNVSGIGGWKKWAKAEWNVCNLLLF